MRSLGRRSGRIRLPEGTPDSTNGHAAQSGVFGHLARTPMSLSTRCTLQCLNHYLFNLLVADFARSTRTLLVIEPPQPLLQEARPPFANHADGAAQLLGHCSVTQTFGEVSVSLRKAVRFIPGGKIGSLS